MDDDIGGIRKAVIPAAGLGTRFLPATKAVPKEMVPLVDKPVIQYAVEEAASVGLRDILIVTGRGKGAIEDHFDRAVELEEELTRRGSDDLLRLVQAAGDLADIHSVRQGTALGLGHAVAMARPHVGRESFAVLLPDDVMPAGSTVLADMLRVHGRLGGSVVALEDVGPERISSYGSVAAEPAGDGIVRITDVVEKPAREDAPSTLRIVGRYVFTAELFDALDDVEPGRNGEIQLTDAIGLLMKEQPVYGCVFDSGLYDTGDKMGFLRATVEVALGREDLREEFGAFLGEVARREGLT